MVLFKRNCLYFFRRCYTMAFGVLEVGEQGGHFLSFRAISDDYFVEIFSLQ